jgi:hypothetical protein
MVSAWYVREAAPAYTDWLASETNRSDERCATRPIPEKRPNRKATVSSGSNNSIEAGNSSSSTIQIKCEGPHSTRWHLPMANGTTRIDGVTNELRLFLAVYNPVALFA